MSGGSNISGGLVVPTGGLAVSASGATIIGSLSITASPTAFYVSTTGVNLTGGMTATGVVTAASLTATSGGATITGGLTVVSGGATITGDSSVTGALSVSGTLSGAGITSLLSPYALKTSLPVPYVAGNGIRFAAATGALSGSYYIQQDSNYPSYCTGLVATGQIGNTTGGMSIVGSSTLTGALTVTGSST